MYGRRHLLFLAEGWLVGSAEGGFGEFMGKAGRFSVSNTTGCIIGIGCSGGEITQRAL